MKKKLTKSRPRERDGIIDEYISSNLLGLHEKIASSNGKLILSCSLSPGDSNESGYLQQTAARLLNVVASLKCGRDYLSIGSSVPNEVMQCMSKNEENLHDTTYDMLIAVLQKLSVRKQQRIYMIEAGSVGRIVWHLNVECCRMSSYRLEYATALLINLSLHKEARARAATLGTMIISTLIALLFSVNLSVSFV